MNSKLISKQKQSKFSSLPIIVRLSDVLHMSVSAVAIHVRYS